VGRARAARDAGQACLEDFDKAVEQSRLSVSGRVRHAREMLQSLGDSLTARASGGNTELASLRRKIDDGGRTLDALDTTLRTLSPLYESKPGSVCPDLKQVLGKAGLASNVPPEAWAIVEGASPGDRQAEEACRTLRDAAVQPQLLAGSAALQKLEPDLRKLGPFAALSGALFAFAQGDLDGAILVLRRAQGTGEIPVKGSEAAIAHAALACFLHTKSIALSMESADKAISEALKQDAQREALLAHQAEPGFRLPDGLFRSQSFRDAFQVYIHDEMR